VQKQNALFTPTISILGQNANHFGPKHHLFWAKTDMFCGKSNSILRQNAFRFAAKWKPFCGKIEIILRQNGY